MKAKWQKRGASPVGKESEVANAHEAFRKHRAVREANRKVVRNILGKQGGIAAALPNTPSKASLPP
jgi:hypothetical protein